MVDESRFAFGENWRAFLAALDEERINQAIASLKTMLKVDNLKGQSFLDLGCGSGLFSLAAYRMGAIVHSVDFDPESVGCTQELRERFADESRVWEVLRGSVLDRPLVDALPMADVVYSWGVLHHTGQMDRAIALTSSRTKPGGRFFIAIYNDQGRASRRWLRTKQIYHRLPTALRPLWVCLVAGWYELKFAAARLGKLRSPLPFADWREKKLDRGMSVWHDWVDWIGGLPFEVAKPEEVIVPLANQGFTIENLKTVGNAWGCNEYVFRKTNVR